MPQRYRRRTQTVETNTKAAYPSVHALNNRGEGTAKVNDRYKTSKPSYNTTNPGYPFPQVVINELWQEPYIQPIRAIAVDLKQPYGSRYRVAGYSSSPNKIVVIQNPVGPLVPTEKGLKSVEQNARLGSMMAQLNAASVARRRR